MSNKMVMSFSFLQYIPKNVIVDELYYESIKQEKSFDVFDINEYIKNDSILESTKPFSMFTNVGMSIFDKNIVEKMNDMIAKEAYKHLEETEKYNIDRKILFIKFQIKNCRNQLQKLNLEDELNKLIRYRRKCK